MTDEERSVEIEEALERLVRTDEDRVHTFRAAPMGILLGAHWDLDDLKKSMEKYGVEEAGEKASAMGHTLVMMDPTSPVFIEARRDDDN